MSTQIAAVTVEGRTEIAGPFLRRFPCDWSRGNPAPEIPARSRKGNREANEGMRPPVKVYRYTAGPTHSIWRSGCDVPNGDRERFWLLQTSGQGKAKRGARVAEYRAYVLGKAGHVLQRLVFECSDDAAAL